MANSQWKTFQSPNQDIAATSPRRITGNGGGNSLYLSSSSSTSNALLPYYQSSVKNKNNSPNSKNSFEISEYNGTTNDQQQSLPFTGSRASELRESGIIEKLLPSYGFIQCCERQARLFFHYSQFNGNIEHLRLGDAVEFEMTCDRRTGKPIASDVVKISSEAALATQTELNSSSVSGFITLEVSDEKEGRVAYEKSGECYFLPFTYNDIVDKTVELKAKDSVMFRIISDFSGNLRATHIVLKTPTPQRFEGVICTLKDSFGFIERADIVKEIFFHSSECKDFKSLQPGDDVEFSIQTRNGKEVAVTVTSLPSGSVVFEDVSPEIYTGQITKCIDRHYNNHSRLQNGNGNNVTNSNGVNGVEPFPGKLLYTNENNVQIEIPYGERDFKSEVTLQDGDFVNFNIVTDRRDKLKHATNIEINEESFKLSGEMRDEGYIAALKDSYGFIKCVTRENGSRVYFKLSELIDNETEPLKLNDEVEFTLVQDYSQPGRLQAIRIKILPNSTIYKNLVTKPQQQQQQQQQQSSINAQNTSNQTFNTNMNQFHQTSSLSSSSTAITMNGFSNYYQPEYTSFSDTSNNGVINNGNNNIVNEVNYYDYSVNNSNNNNNNNEAEVNRFRFTNHGVQDFFNMSLNDEKNDNDDSPDEIVNGKNAEWDQKQKSPIMKNGKACRGFIAVLKESFGFIESEDHQNEIFFRYSAYDGDIDYLEEGCEVKYTAVMRNGKVNADYVKKIQKGSIEQEEILPDIYDGKVMRAVRCMNPEQEEYPGLIEIINETIDGQSEFEFSMASLSDIHDFVQKGDLVTFQIGIDKNTQNKRAVKVKSIRTKHQSTVDAIKGNFGFLNYEAEEGKKLFFHMTEVKGDSSALYPGDLVEFYIVHNQKSGKYSACSVFKISENNTQRPERLINRIKLLAIEKANGPSLIIIRQPKGPDGTKGFNSKNKSKQKMNE